MKAYSKNKGGSTGLLPPPIFRKANVYFASAYEGKLMVSEFARSLTDYSTKVASEIRAAKQIPNKGYVQKHAALFGVSELTAVSSWHETPALEHPAGASIDFNDIESSHILVSLYPYGYGTATEMGYALGLGLPVLYVVDHNYLHDLPFGAHHFNCEVVVLHDPKSEDQRPVIIRVYEALNKHLATYRNRDKS